MQPFDYIVVGGGSAGCVVARRLSDDPGVRVLLLEAGPAPRGFWLRAPAGMAKLFKLDRYNWGYFTEPAPNLHHRRIYWPRGKVLGGSSAINGMVHVRGHAKDFDHWAALGNSGWSWDEVLPCFQRLENNQRGPGHGRGVGGPLTVSDPTVIHRSVREFIASAQICGIPLLDDLPVGDNDGVGLCQFNIRNGERQSSYDAYVRPIEGRPNLTIRTEARVRRILFDGRAATGVEIGETGATETLHARREVILSAGALNSPHLLMLSGIGPGAMLQAAGVAVLHNVPGVGQNLQDHFVARVQVRTHPGASYNRDLRGWRAYLQGALYVLLKRGYLSLGSSSAAAFVKSGRAMDYGDLEISFRAMTFGFGPDGQAKVDGNEAMSASVYRTRPASRGEIVLRSPDPLAAPAFIPNFLTAPEDIAAMIAGIRWIRRIWATEPLAARILGEIVPGEGLISDTQLQGYLEREGQCAFHPAGTAKMGRDPMAVVDERLRVRGLDRLRVIDASIMPVVTSGNTNAPTVMIGEKGAEMVRADAAPARAAAA